MDWSLPNWTNATRSLQVLLAIYLQNRLQSVLNAAARLIYSRRASEHTTPLLRDLHWLRIPERIQFSVVCSGISLCARRSTGVSGRQPAADIGVRRRSPSMLHRHNEAAGAAVSAGNLRRPRVSGGCGASVEQSATTHQGRLITPVISAADESSSLSSVIQLTQFCTIFVPAVLHVMFFLFYFLPCAKCPCNFCEASL